MNKKHSSECISLPKNLYQEFCEEFNSIAQDNWRLYEEIRYMEAFIELKKLNNEFTYFKENVYDKYDESLPFPTLTL